MGGNYIRQNKAIPIEKVCECCKQPYLIKRYDTKHGQKHVNRRNREQKYCSWQCQRSSRAAIRIYYRPCYKYEGFTARDGNFYPWHKVMAEKALGRPMDGRKETVHHVDGNKLNNVNTNFVICSPAYHKWLHQRMSYLYQQEHFAQREA